MSKLSWYDKLLQWLGLMTVDRHNYEVAIAKASIAAHYESRIKEAFIERDDLIAENERVAGLMQNCREEVEWSQKTLRRANEALYEAWAELNDDHPITAKGILDEYFDDDDDDFCDGGDDDALCTETAPADSGGVPQDP